MAPASLIRYSRKCYRFWTPIATSRGLDWFRRCVSATRQAINLNRGCEIVGSRGRLLGVLNPVP